MGHSVEEEKRLFAINLRFLQRESYQLNDNDIQFLKNNPRLWNDNELILQWLQQ